MTQPAAEQLLNLADRAEKGLTPDEAQRLRDGLTHHCARAERAEAELTALKSISSGYCPECGRGDCSPTAGQWYEQVQRAERAAAALAAFRDTVQAITDEARGGIRQQLGYALAALDPQEPQPEAAPHVEPEPVCNCHWGGLEIRRCPVHEPTT
ncbi:hypothetical protein [Streptomyces sp. NPDC101115]|uniref:hypothetical protein n=1 Tax=Streptomyces sp. NPDC101115 TaxID=3366106 RepID=UPI00381C9B0E